MARGAPLRGAAPIPAAQISHPGFVFLSESLLPVGTDKSFVTLVVNINTMKWISTLGALACLLVIVGAVMAILHMAGGKAIGTTGLALFFVYLGARSFDRKRGTTN